MYRRKSSTKKKVGAAGTGTRKRKAVAAVVAEVDSDTQVSEDKTDEKANDNDTERQGNEKASEAVSKKRKVTSSLHIDEVKRVPQATGIAHVRVSPMKMSPTQLLSKHVVSGHAAGSLHLAERAGNHRPIASTAPTTRQTASLTNLNPVLVSKREDKSTSKTPNIVKQLIVSNFSKRIPVVSPTKRIPVVSPTKRTPVVSRTKTTPTRRNTEAFSVTSGNENDQTSPKFSSGPGSRDTEDVDERGDEEVKGEVEEEGDIAEGEDDGGDDGIVDDDEDDVEDDDDDGDDDEEEALRPKRKKKTAAAKKPSKVVFLSSASSASLAKRKAARLKIRANAKTSGATGAAVTSKLKKKRVTTAAAVSSSSKKGKGKGQDNDNNKKKKKKKKKLTVNKKPKKPKKPKVAKTRSTTRKKRERLMITNRQDFVDLLADAIALSHVRIVTNDFPLPLPVSALPLSEATHNNTGQNTLEAKVGEAIYKDEVLAELQARLAAVSSARRRTQKRKPGGLATNNPAAKRLRRTRGEDDTNEDGDGDGDDDGTQSNLDGEKGVDVDDGSVNGSGAASVFSGSGNLSATLADDVDFQTLVTTSNLRLAPDKTNCILWCRHVEELVLRISETRSDHACRIHAIASHILHTRTVPDSTLYAVMLQYDYYAPLVTPSSSSPSSDFASGQQSSLPLSQLPSPPSRKLKRGERLSRAEMAHVFRTYTLAQILEWLGLDDATVLYRCPACKKWRGDVDKVTQKRSLDEGATVQLRCGACKYNWR
jgi:hypothetical protein